MTLVCDKIGEAFHWGLGLRLLVSKAQEILSQNLLIVQLHWPHQNLPRDSVIMMFSTIYFEICNFLYIYYTPDSGQVFFFFFTYFHLFCAALLISLEKCFIGFLGAHLYLIVWNWLYVCYNILVLKYFMFSAICWKENFNF